MARNMIGRAQNALPGDSGGLGKTDGAPGTKCEAPEKGRAPFAPYTASGTRPMPKTPHPANRPGGVSRWAALLAAGFWLCVWQAASLCIGQRLLLASPVEVCRALLRLLPTAAFWQRAAFSAARIIGADFAYIGSAFIATKEANAVEGLLRPPMLAIRTVPVASFIILALLWLRGTGGLSVFISFLMVLPVVYENVLAGIRAADETLLEMAAVFRVPLWRRMRALYAPAVLPYFRSACAVGLGLCWKSGVAAEVIGISGGSIGEALYNAKLLFATDELLAWTAVIVLLSLAFERLFLRLLQCAERRLMGGAAHE